MNCPVCKYPNTAGASHCGMCYEVLNRSAAQTYLIKQKREKRSEEAALGETADPTPPTPSFTESWRIVLSRVDWPAVKQAAAIAFRRIRPYVIGLSGLMVLWWVATVLINPGLWYHGFGKRLNYPMPKASDFVLVGFTQDIHSWSERQGRMDTPLEKSKWEEIGTVFLAKSASKAKNRQSFQARAKEWIQISSDPKGSYSHVIPLDHPSLGNVPVTFDKKGVLVERKAGTAARVAKGLIFIYPKFPSGRLRRGQTWSEKVEWTDFYHDWKVHWAGTFYWTLGDMQSCAQGTCLSLTYRGDLQPSLWSAPSWASDGVKRVKGEVTTEGTLVLEAKRNTLLTNLFSYHGRLRIPIDDLVRIPWELRIGRRVRGAGDILIQFDNLITIRKN